MIRETPIRDHLIVQAREGGRRDWVDLGGHVTSATVKRGGGRSAPVNKMNVGTATVALTGDLDVRFDRMVQPGSPLRIVRRDVKPGKPWLNWADINGFRVGLPTIWDDDPAVSWALAWAGTGHSVEFSIKSDGTGDGPPEEWLIYNGTELGRYFVPIEGGRSYRITASLADLSPREKTVPALISVSFPELYPYARDDDTIETGYSSELRPYSTDTTEISVEFPVDPRVTYAHVLIVFVDRGLVLDTSTVDEIMHYRVDGLDIVQLPTEPTPLFTGRLLDVQQKHDLNKSTGDLTTFTTLIAVDAVQSHANTQRYGAITDGGAGYESWQNRMRRLAKSSREPVRIPASNNVVTYAIGDDLDRWSPHSGDSWQGGGGYVERTSDGARYRWEYKLKSDATAGSVFFRQFPNRWLGDLKPGTEYRVTMRARLAATHGQTFDWDEWFLQVRTEDDNGNVTSVYNTETVTLPGEQQNGVAFPEVIMTADTYGLTLQLLPESMRDGQGNTDNSPRLGDTGETLDRSSMAALEIWDVSVTELHTPDEFLLQDVAYESSLVNHFDMACNSVNGRWWVDVHGVTQFRQRFAESEIAAHFSDRPDEGHRHYVNLSTGFDTGNVVNTLTLTQNGRAEDNGSWHAVTTNYLQTSQSSIETWGDRAGSINTCLYLGDGHEHDLETVAGRILREHAQSRFQIGSIRWNAQEDVDLAASLDVYDRVRVFFGDLMQTCRVVGIRHEISGERWIITYDLSDIKTGPTFDDFNAAFDGWTFDDFNESRAGDTFDDFTRDTLAK